MKSVSISGIFRIHIHGFIFIIYTYIFNMMNIYKYIYIYIHINLVLPFVWVHLDLITMLPCNWTMRSKNDGQTAAATQLRNRRCGFMACVGFADSEGILLLRGGGWWVWRWFRGIHSLDTGTEWRGVFCVTTGFAVGGCLHHAIKAALRFTTLGDGKNQPNSRGLYGPIIRIPSLKVGWPSPI